MISRLALLLAAGGLLLLGLHGHAVCQSHSEADELVQAIGNALANADARLLSELASGQVELDLGGGTSMYSRDQARYVFRSFFEEHPPSAFNLGDVTKLQDTCTAQGRYMSLETNQPWSVFMRLSRSREMWRLKELRMTRSFEFQAAPQSGLPQQLPPR